MQDIEMKDKNYIKDAEKIANIVTAGVENKEYSKISEEIEELANYGSDKEIYVFNTTGKILLDIENIILYVLSIIFVYTGVVGIGILRYSEKYRVFGIIELIVSVIFIAYNIISILIVHKKKKFINRYKKYYEMLRFRKIVILDDLVNFSKESKKDVIDDLNQAVEQKLIPEGHFGTDNSIFITSNEVFEKYKNKQSLYDRYYRKQIEERNRMMERTDEMKNIINQGNHYIDKIQEINKIIKDKVISQKLDKMEQIVRMIFHEVDINPKKIDKLGLCLNYYLPTMEKLLEAYIEICDNQVKSKGRAKSKKDIERALDTLNGAFEKILDKFYEEKEMDIASDIAVLEIMVKQNK